MSIAKNIIMLGATGAVGNHVALTLSESAVVNRLTLLGRRPAENITGPAIAQHEIDIFSPESYQSLIGGHEAAVCTLGVGQPSKMSKEDFVKTDKNALLDFAIASKNEGVSEFSLLSSVGVSSTSSSSVFLTSSPQGFHSLFRTIVPAVKQFIDGKH